MIDNITYAAKRGVTVRILLPHIYDKQMAYLAGRTDFRTYLESGIEIYEFTPGFVHSKVAVLGDKKGNSWHSKHGFSIFLSNFNVGFMYITIAKF